MGRFKTWYEHQIDLPTVRQSTKYDCGPACLRSICQYYGVGSDDEDWYIDACQADSKMGTRPENLIKVARSLDLKAEMRERLTIEELMRFLDEKKPVICAIQAWGDPEDYHKLQDGHYVIAIGYDNKRVYFEDPSLKNVRGHLDHDEFSRRWKDVDKNKKKLNHFGLVIWKNTEPSKESPDLEKSSKID